MSTKVLLVDDDIQAAQLLRTHLATLGYDVSILSSESEALAAIESERKHLKESVAAMEQVLGVVAHELRTPLAGLRTMSEFLLMPEAKELAEWDTFLMTMNSEITRMAEMVNSLLEAARLNSGVATWHWGTVKYAIASADALDVVRPLIDQSKLTLHYSCEPEDLEGNGDPDAIRRLIINLVNNAAKHTPSGSISVSCRRIDIQTVELRVADTGKGIDPNLAPRLGEPFALNSGAVGPKHIQGTGLGLAICKGIAAAHGGQITIESAPGKGTTVVVRLRCDLAAAQSTGQKEQIIRRISA